MKAIFFFIAISVPLMTWSQSGLISHYSFDGCSRFDAISGQVAHEIGTPGCDCAFSNDGIIFSGSGQGLDSLQVSSGFFNQDFTIRFYFNPSNVAGLYEVLSKGDDCFENSFVTTYDAGINLFTVRLAESLSRSVLLTGDVIADVCWHEIVIIRRGIDYRLVIDGQQESRVSLSGGVNITTTAPMGISRGTCGGGLQPLDAVIDELSFYNRALNISEYGQLLAPDNLLSQDTIIFEGDTVFARSLINCADVVNWTPASSVSDPSSPNPALFPSQTTTYSVSYKSDQCFSTDTMRVIVTTPEALDCSRLDLPTAFTPNADGVNDFFGISNPFLINDLESFDIYDRQGAIVFSGINTTDLWDGDVNGTRLNSGLYVYKIRYSCQGTDQLKIGTVTLMR